MPQETEERKVKEAPQKNSRRRTIFQSQHQETKRSKLGTKSSRENKEYYCSKPAPRAKVAKEEKESKEAAREAEAKKDETEKKGEEPKPKAVQGAEEKEHEYSCYTTEEREEKLGEGSEPGTPHFSSCRRE